MTKFDSQRHRLLLGSSALAGMAVFSFPTLASLSTSRPRTLILNNIHTGENITTEFFNGTAYDRKELTRLNHFFRDYRTNQVKTIDPKLFDQLHYLQILLGTRKPVQLLSGYRTIATNNMLRERSPRTGVAKNSYHIRGQAMDFHIEGVNLANIRKAALSIGAGGVGYYPRSNFVHIDTGPVRRW